MTFLQDAPASSNRFRTDRVLRHALERQLPAEVFAEVSPTLDEVGERARTTWPALAEQAEQNPPRHVRFDAWGKPVDRIEVDPAWLTLVAEGRRAGVASIPYEGRFGAHARTVQFATIELYGPVSATGDCPLSMTDAAVRVLMNEDPVLASVYVPRLIAREGGWTSGQWMTEKEGGSDVGRTATIARTHGDGTWTLHGTKWFTSATTADIALALARPEGAGDGSRGLSLFLLELRNPDGSWNGLSVRRLKDKLGTHALPTAELDLAGTLAVPVGGIGDGVRKIASMLNITRVHAAVGSVAGIGEGLSLVRDYAGKRSAFGRPLRDLPLHRRWIADVAARYEAFHALSSRAVALLGALEHGSADPALVRVVLPLTKLLCARGGTDVASQIVESFGGAGYLEDTGIPRILRDIHVNCIWEGTTSVMALDVLRALRADGVAAALLDDVRAHAAPHRTVAPLSDAVRAVDDALEELTLLAKEPAEVDARRVAFGLANTYALALTIDAAAWALRVHEDPRAATAARILASHRLVPAASGAGSDDEAALAFDTV